MNTTMENPISTTNHRPSSDERKQSPPAFLDLADSVSRFLTTVVFPVDQFMVQQAARLGSNMPDMSAVSIHPTFHTYIFCLYSLSLAC
jgi:hypothetical protein